MLYEMLTGRRAFDRGNPIETLAAILKDEPEPIGAANPRIPPPLAWIVERCLAKAPEGRYAATADLLHDLRAVGSRTPIPGPRKTTLASAARTAVAALALAGAGWMASSFMRAAPVDAPQWQRLTYEQGFVDSARFAGDGQTVVYSASWDNRPFAVFTTTTTSPESRALDLPPAGVLAVSRTGELAVSLDCVYVQASGVCAGTLARVPQLGGAPRELAGGIRSADWSPDGSLAVARLVSNLPRLSVEYPMGTQLSPDGLGHVRVSPDGTRVAWSAVQESNLQAVMLHDASGTRALSRGWTFISGLAWSPGGDAVFVSGVGPDVRDDAVIRVGMDGSQRAVVRGMRRMLVLDAGAGDRLLVAWTNSSTRMEWWGPGDPDRPRDLTWLGDSFLDAASVDGQRILFTVRAAGTMEWASQPDLYPVYVRTADQQPAVRIASGYGVALSPDGRWALTRTRPEEGLADLVLVPLGPGEPRTLDRGGLDTGSGNSIATFADSDRIVLRARVPGQPWRTYVQRIGGGPPVVVPHEPGFVDSPLAPDGDRFVAHRPDGSHWLASLSRADVARPLPIPSEQLPLAWSTDGRALVLWREEGSGGIVSRLDLTTDIETTMRRIEPASRAGFVGFRGMTASRGGAVVMGSETRMLGALYLITGAR
ncbi:MAG: hypothetical protein R2712_02690 [Vicinamibacterales bacterium]